MKIGHTPGASRKNQKELFFLFNIVDIFVMHTVGVSYVPTNVYASKLNARVCKSLAFSCLYTFISGLPGYSYNFQNFSFMGIGSFGGVGVSAAHRVISNIPSAPVGGDPDDKDKKWDVDDYLLLIIVLAVLGAMGYALFSILYKIFLQYS